ncbi:hypothetical protein FQN53_007385 [Emmonsiellopsis sp. PD_33]|nr:hypothetical protein FQN53_007385 [Emmonsiellopsis sp. PD_33]
MPRSYSYTSVPPSAGTPEDSSDASVLPTTEKGEIRGKSPVPHVPLTKDPIVFDIHERWNGHSPETEQLWADTLMNGFVMSFVLDNPRDYDLGQGAPVGNGRERFGISMYHQLHCLASIRAAYFHGNETHQHHGRDNDNPSMNAILKLLRQDPHVEHCFDYLRQSIECSADLTVEWARVEEDGSRKDIDGWGVPHYQCKDLSVVEKYIRENK